MEEVKFRGVEIELAGKKYVMPPLPIKAFSKENASEKLQKIAEDVKKMGQNGWGAITADSWNALVELVTMALRRNYPDITPEDVEDGIEDAVTLMGLMEDLISQNDKYKQQMAEQRKNILKQLTKEGNLPG